MKQSGGVTPEEQQRRREIFERARYLVESAGLTVPAHVLAQGERYITGEIELADALQKGSYEGDASRAQGVSEACEGKDLTMKRCRTRLDHGPYIGSDITLLDAIKPRFRDDRHYTEAEVERLGRSGVLKPEMDQPAR